jgi:hypothetical protein
MIVTLDSQCIPALPVSSCAPIVILSLSKDDGESTVAQSWFDKLTMTLGAAHEDTGSNSPRHWEQLTRTLGATHHDTGSSSP